MTGANDEQRRLRQAAGLLAQDADRLVFGNDTNQTANPTAGDPFEIHFPPNQGAMAARVKWACLVESNQPVLAFKFERFIEPGESVSFTIPVHARREAGRYEVALCSANPRGRTNWRGSLGVQHELAYPGYQRGVWGSVERPAVLPISDHELEAVLRLQSALEHTGFLDLVLPPGDLRVAALALLGRLRCSSE